MGEPAATQAPDREFLEQYFRSGRFRRGRPTSFRVTPDGSAVLFLRSRPETRVQDLFAFDPSSGEERALLTAEAVLAGAEEHLSPEERARRERQRLTARGITSFRLSADGRYLVVPLGGRLFVVERESLAVRELPNEGGYPIDPQMSPHGRYVACVRGGNLFVIEVEAGAQRQITHGKEEGVTYGLAEFVAQEEMGRMHGYWWSPDSRWLVCQRTDTRGVETLYIADPAHPEREPQGWPYPRAGRANAEVTLRLYSVDGEAGAEIVWDRQRYPYLATVRWSENAPLTLVVQNRRQTEEAVLEADPLTGQTRTLLIERDEAWLNLDQQMPRWLADGSGFLWTTERRGAWQLELRNRHGGLEEILTPAGMGYRGLVHVDEGGGYVIVRASADPTQVYLWRVPLDPDRGEPEPLHSEPGVHSAVYSEDGSVYVHTYSGPAGSAPPRVRRADGVVVGEIRSLAVRPTEKPHVIWTTVEGERRYHAAVIRPRDFDPGKRYALIVHVYAGPHGQMVTATAERYYFEQWLADCGFLVVAFDGRGTPGRGREWERAIRGNFVAVPLHDQVDALQALGRQMPQADLERVGIYGWSFGGYMSAMAVLQRPDVFHAAVAGAPVVDWHDYDTHYTERYLGLPEENPEGYEASSVLTWAGDLRRPLLIIHGTADDNVYFVHSLRLADALLRSGGEFGFVPLMGFTHMVPDPDVQIPLYLRIAEFFREHLSSPAEPVAGRAEPAAGEQDGGVTPVAEPARAGG